MLLLERGHLREQHWLIEMETDLITNRAIMKIHLCDVVAAQESV